MKDEIKKVEEFLSSKDFIVFALFFGSFARGLANDISDVDIGIYVERDISILEYGNFVSQLQSLTGKRRDLIILNNPYEKNPRFAYQIISQGKVFFTKSENLWADYGRKVFLYYFDAESMLRMMDGSFLKRIKEGKIDYRNYKTV
ncbi:MAG: hypothetical protein C0189_00775 [Caldisericum exile]|uniref:Polymerase beta nucleotidyltransferase domain-containing protein n=2 Tax=Caldisericum TaxID=693074 RepID=A0A2J6WFP3_9BACT|nr:MAG: hypothetical protein C0189_00775 [Caldisericum exile]